MSYFVDIVNEDSFYENLTLGIIKQLEANPCIKNVQLERRTACDRAALTAWEQKHCCLLTEELRNFYSSIDGFLLTWSLDIAGEEFPIGRMEMKDLRSLKRHIGMTVNNNAKEQPSSTCVTNYEIKPPIVGPNFGGSRSKLFELAECDDCLIFLAYQLQPDQDEPSIWLYNVTMNQWYHLANNFSKYFRMMLVYLGLPLWQKCAAGLQLPTWIEQVYLLVGPHLLQSTTSDVTTPSVSAESSLRMPGPTNIVDPAIFRNKEHHHGSKQKTNGSSSAISSTTGNARKKSSSH